jgi:predicted PurR-regulated permease PerM
VARRPPAPPAWVFVTAAVLLLAAYRIHEVLIPFVLSFALAYLLNPIVRFFEVRGMRRDLVVIAIYSVVAAALSLAANSLLPAMGDELARLQGRAPDYFVKAQELIREAQHALAERLPYGKTVVELWSLKLYDPLMEQLPKIPSYVLGLVPLFSLIFLVPFITFFVLLDSLKLLRRIVQLCPSRYVEQTLHLCSEIDTSLGNYIRGILIVALAIGAASYIGLKVLRVDYALAIAALAGIASFIPYLGAILGMAVGALVAFFQYHTFLIPFQVVILFVGIRLGDEAFVQPVIAKHSVHLHPLVFLLSLMVGGKVFGFVGLLFAVPAACMIKALLTVAWDWYSSETQTGPPETMAGVRIPYV